MVVLGVFKYSNAVLFYCNGYFLVPSAFSPTGMTLNNYEFLKINVLILLRVKIDYDFASWFIKRFAWFMISILRNNKLRKTILH